MICNSAHELVVKHLSHLLGYRPSGYEVDSVLARVEGRTSHPAQLERIAREEAARFVRGNLPSRRNDTMNATAVTSRPKEP
jgi:hypothetical protein